MRVTHTKVYTRITPANPYLVCALCGKRVEYWLDGEEPPSNHPCGHHADYIDLCPSWSPVDGCTCAEPHRAARGET